MNIIGHGCYGLDLGFGYENNAVPTSFWTPLNLTSLTGWHRSGNSSYFQTSGTDITQWTDYSGNSNHLTQSAGSSAPQLVNNRCLNANGDYLIGNSNGVKTIAIVYSATWTGEHVNVVHSGGNVGTAAELFLGGTTGAGANTISFDGTGTSQGRYAIAGDSWSSYATGFSTNAHQSKNFALFEYDANKIVWTIGKRYDNSFNFEGAFYFFAFINATLSTADKAKLEGYMAHTYGFESQLPAGHTYKSSPPTV